MYSTEKFISQIQNYPCLWDISSKEYSNKDLKISCWMKVAEVVYSTKWNNFSSTEKEEIVNELRKKKWRHIRDAYNKYLSDEKNIRSGSKATKKKPYIYAECLSFLNNTSKKRKTTGNCEAVEEDNATELSVDDIVDIDDNNYEVSEEELNQSHKEKKFTNVTPFQKTWIEHLIKNNEKESDPDRHLVMSFLPYLKKLNNDQKLDFQIHTLKYLKKFTQTQTTSDHPIYSLYPTYYPLAQNMTSNMQYSYNSSVSTHPYSYPYASQSQTSVSSIEIPINPPNSQYSNTEHTIQTQQYTPISQFSPSDS